MKLIDGTDLINPHFGLITRQPGNIWELSSDVDIERFFKTLEEAKEWAGKIGIIKVLIAQ